MTVRSRVCAGLILAGLAGSAMAEEPVEIGYVEDLHPGAGAITLERGGKILPVA